MENKLFSVVDIKNMLLLIPNNIAITLIDLIEIYGLLTQSKPKKDLSGVQKTNLLISF